MEFRITSTCHKCGRKFSTRKRYNDFIGQWELDSDSCDECVRSIAKRIGEISLIVNVS